jgi:sterol desaturase/sphingolipid hydroxylase (fatty acid hydroxylase superfamily)
MSGTPSHVELTSSKVEVVCYQITVDVITCPKGGRKCMKVRSIILDVGRTALLTAALIGALMATDHLFHGALARPFCIGLLISCGALAFFSLLERAVPAGGPRKSRTQWLLNLRIGIFHRFSGLLIGTSVTTAVVAAAAVLRPQFHLGLIDLRFADGKGIVGLVGAVIVSLVVEDFFFYWYHRLEHKSKWLWQIHKLHHMDRELDVLTDVRHNWLESAVTSLFASVPMMILFKFDHIDPFKLGATAGVLITVLQTAIGNLNHFNARWHFGRVGWLINGPQMHRIHHSRLEGHRDTNFVGFFTPWDIVFGTYYDPAQDEFPPTGVEGEPAVQSVWEAHTLSVREWWSMFRAWRHRAAAA